MSTQATALRRSPLSRPVWLLGWVSFFTDTASEMVYPLLPLFLTRTLGAGAMSLGVIEGVADAANSALKIASGWFADRFGQPKRIVLAGYGLSSSIRPLLALATVWPQVFALRFADRLGKGIRGAPRDAMLAFFADPQQRGRVYGFHRAMDHAGAVLGPLLASLFLFFNPGDYRTLFALTLIPGAIVILVLLRVPDIEVDRGSARDRGSRLAGAAQAAGPAQLARPPGATGGSLRAQVTAAGGGRLLQALGVIFLFSLGNASDAFLLLRLSDLGVTAFWIPLLWSALHVVKVVSSLAGGNLSDRHGRRTIIGAGWILYATVYAGFGAATDLWIVIAIFLSYGIYFGLTEGVEKAWVADLASPSARGTAFGLYNAVIGLGSLAASLLFGFIWTRVSPSAAFYTGAALALLATILLTRVPAARSAA